MDLSSAPAAVGRPRSPSLAGPAPGTPPVAALQASPVVVAAALALSLAFGLLPLPRIAAAAGPSTGADSPSVVGSPPAPGSPSASGPPSRPDPRGAFAAAPAGTAIDGHPARVLDQYVRRTWTIEDGLPQNSGTDLLQDREGYLWIATYGGLARFDGVRFESFSAATTGLPSDRLRALAEDPAGGLWIGTESHGLARLRDGVFSSVEPSPEAPLGHVSTLRFGPSGRLWAGTDRGLLGWDGERWERFLPAAEGDDAGEDIAPPGGDAGSLAEVVVSVVEARDGTVWVGTLRGLARLRGGHLEPAFPEHFAAVSIHALHEDRDGTLWIGSGHGRLWRRAAGGTPEPVDLGLGGAGTVREVLDDRNGDLWVAVDPQGVRRLTRDGVDAYQRRDGPLLDRAVSLLEDREGNVWIGTAGRGLHQLTLGEALALGGPAHALEGGVVPLEGDGAGGLFAGLACNGVVHMGADGRLSQLGTGDGLSNLCVWSLLHDEAGTLWIGTLGGGLFRLPRAVEASRGGGAGGRLQALPGPTTRGRAVQALLADERWGLLVGTDEGVFRIAASETPRPRFERLPGTARHHVQHLAVDPGGTLWIGTVQGPFALAPDADRPVAPPAALAGRLADASVRAIHFDDAGGTWFGTYGQGLFRLHGHHLAHLGTAQGLAENVVSWIGEDDRGRLWLTGNRGVQRVQRAALEAVAEARRGSVATTLFTAADGMRISECNGGGQPAGLLDGEGLLWVPTLDGIARFDTRDPVRNLVPPPVRIESVTVGGQALPGIAPPPGSTRGGDGGGVGRPEAPVQLGAGARNLEIRYTALSFLDPKRVRFRYRLEGQDEEWQEAGTRRVAYYPFLPPGRHHFRVIASNEDGVWNEEGASFTFVVEPRFVETTAFRLLLLAALALAVAGAVRLRLGAVRRREERLRQEVRTRTGELEEMRLHLERANRRLERLATLDPLTGIANRRSLMERLDVEWRRAVRQQAPLGLLMIDIDQFKPYNDLHGHPAGDRCLKEVVARLQLQLRRAEDLLARYGGEELVAVLPGVTGVDALRRMAEALRRRVEEARLPHGASPIAPWLTVSIGGALVVPSREDSLEGLLAVADTALYAAKKSGRNRVVVVKMGPVEEDGAAVAESALSMKGQGLGTVLEPDWGG